MAASVDIYSLGAILYELLTGRPPFRAETPLETILQVLHEEPVSPSRLHPQVPRDLEAICLKCLEKSPRRRYHSALELAEDLHRFQHFEPVRARHVAAPGRLWRWCRRKTSLAIAAGLAAIAISATIALSISLALYQYRAATRLGDAIREIRAHRRQVDQQASHLAYEHGQSLCEQGDVAHGMLWLVRGLRSASLARDPDLERAFRRNLSGWWTRIHRLEPGTNTPPRSMPRPTVRTASPSRSRGRTTPSGSGTSRRVSRSGTRYSTRRRSAPWRSAPMDVSS